MKQQLTLEEMVKLVDMVEDWKFYQNSLSGELEDLKLRISVSFEKSETREDRYSIMVGYGPGIEPEMFGRFMGWSELAAAAYGRALAKYEEKTKQIDMARKKEIEDAFQKVRSALTPSDNNL